MDKPQTLTIDGNQAAAMVAHKLNEVIAIYPITPASPMGEWADEWSAHGQTNLWGTVPRIIEMQSEGGAAGAIHGSLQAGALTTTFTASQGLLLMLPNMYKIAAELSPAVFNIAARSVACQALSIFGDHSDVMTTRMTGFAMLFANSPQEVHDMSLIAQAASLRSRVPVLHVFDGFRTSHEVAKIELLSDATLRALIRDEDIAAHRNRGLSPDHPLLRGSSQNPDVFFQARETVNPYYEQMPAIVQQVMDEFEQHTGRRYELFQYLGDPKAERVMLLMGSGAEAAEEAVEFLARQGEKVGLLKVRLYRPFAADVLLSALPDTTRAIAVLDRTKEPGADGEPLYKDVVSAIAQDAMGADPRFAQMPKVVGGRYGLSSKEFTPGMVKAVLDELQQPQPKNHFTIGIHDDVSHSSLDWEADYRTDHHADNFQGLFYGLGSDGTVSANKNSIKIIGDHTELHAQGYFVYDSKKSGAVTVSHLRFGPRPIHASYLIGDNEANFVACHQPVFLERYPMLDKAADGAVFLLNSALQGGALWDSLPHALQQQMIDKGIRFYHIDAYAVAERHGLGKRINTIMQTCFFAISEILPRDQAIDAIKAAVAKTYGRKGQSIVRRNDAAIDDTLACLHEFAIPKQASGDKQLRQVVPDTAPEFVRQVTAEIIAGRGDQVPVSLFPADGSYPLGTAAYEKRNLALEIPIWEPELCTQCGKCPLVCPHAAIRSKVMSDADLKKAPAAFRHAPTRSKVYESGLYMSYQVAPEDCTGCGLCSDICPIRDKSNASRKALNMAPQPPLREQERANWDYFVQLPEYDRSLVKINAIPSAMLLQPLFEFSGACAGCGETPYLRLATQLFGDRMVVANATGCSSIYGGNLPTTPWTKNSEGRGPAWNNSLFEDNAEFGLGMRLAVDKRRERARSLLMDLRGKLDEALVDAILNAEEVDEPSIHEQRERIEQLKAALAKQKTESAEELLAEADYLSRKSVWIIGGDGWAYDIGYGGLDHVLASGQDVNILVLDTEVYSNTGGQTSKATPLGAVAKFSAGGKPNRKKDLGMLAMDYEDVYVAQIAYGAKDTQALHAMLEAEAHRGPSIIIAYSPCIAHGVDLKFNHRQQQLAVDSGHWPLFRFDPKRIHAGKNPLHLDSKPPSIPYSDFVHSETRFDMLWGSMPKQAEHYLQQAQEDVLHRYQHYQHLAEIPWDDPEELARARAKLVRSKEAES